MLLTCPVHKGCRRRFFVLPEFCLGITAHTKSDLFKDPRSETQTAKLAVLRTNSQKAWRFGRQSIVKSWSTVRPMSSSRNVSKLQLCRASWTRNSPGLRNNGRRLQQLGAPCYLQQVDDISAALSSMLLITRDCSNWIPGSTWVNTTDFHRFLLPLLAVFLWVHQDPSFQRQTLHLCDFWMSKKSGNTPTFTILYHPMLILVPSHGHSAQNQVK